jgi:hypothetical protein
MAKLYVRNFGYRLRRGSNRLRRLFVVGIAVSAAWIFSFQCLFRRESAKTLPPSPPPSDMGYVKVSRCGVHRGTRLPNPASFAHKEFMKGKMVEGGGEVCLSALLEFCVRWTASYDCNKK